MINFTEEGLIIAISYLIPGFLINILISNRFYLEKNLTPMAVYKYLFFSVINIYIYTLVDKLVFRLYGSYVFFDNTVISLLRNLILPVLIGIMIIKLLENKKSKITTYSLLRYLGLTKEALTTNSWDYIFYNLMFRSGSFLLITLKDGREIYGWFGGKSFASNHTAGNNDIYLENTYDNFESQKSNNCGVWLNEKEILTIDIPHVASDSK